MKKLDELSVMQDMDSKLFKKLKSKFSVDELKKIADSGRLVTASKNTKIDFSGTSIKMLVMSDTHIGSAYDNVGGIHQAFEEGAKEKCDILLHAGDVLDGDGMDKKGYVYDLRVIGCDKQREEAEKVFNQWTKPSYFISGNHDLHAFKSSGVDVVEAFCRDGNRTYIGKGQGTLILKKSNIELFHGEDSGSGYAYSYRVQQITRAITGGYKPNILITGHDHKALYVYSRMIHCIGGGALSNRSRWMQQKRLEHHQGFWIVTAWFDSKCGVAKIQPTFYPFYK